MAKTILNPIIRELYGELGGYTYRRRPGGQLSIIKTPDMSRVVWSPAQAAHRERFRQANLYAKAAMADPAARALYEREAAASGRTPYHLAVSDFFKGRNLLP